MLTNDPPNSDSTIAEYDTLRDNAGSGNAANVYVTYELESPHIYLL
jgi:hypothetical protein